MLYAVSPENQTMYSVDITAELVVHKSIFYYGIPTAISVYIPETPRSSQGKLFKINLTKCTRKIRNYAKCIIHRAPTDNYANIEKYDLTTIWIIK